MGSKRTDKKDHEDDNWEEEQVVANTMKVEVAGKLTREEDKKEEDEAEGKVAWATGKKVESGNSNLNEKKYPSLAKSMLHASAVAAHASVDNAGHGLETSKNVFASLNRGNESDSEEDAPKAAKKGVLVQKKKGETEKAATQRAKKGGKYVDE